MHLFGRGGLVVGGQVIVFFKVVASFYLRERVWVGREGSEIAGFICARKFIWIYPG